MKSREWQSLVAALARNVSEELLSFARQVEESIDVELDDDSAGGEMERIERAIETCGTVERPSAMPNLSAWRDEQEREALRARVPATSMDAIIGAASAGELTEDLVTESLGPLRRVTTVTTVPRLGWVTLECGHQREVDPIVASAPQLRCSDCVQQERPEPEPALGVSIHRCTKCRRHKLELSAPGVCDACQPHAEEGGEG